MLQSDFVQMEARPVVLRHPDIHEGPESLKEVPDLFDRLRPRSADASEGPSVEWDATEEEDRGRIERLAWYQSFRSQGDWGIFIREAGIVQVAFAIAKSKGAVTTDDWRVAGTALYLHEYAHFLVDISVASLEGVLGADLYGPLRIRTPRTSPGWNLLEEAVCNAFALRNLRAPGYSRRVRAFLRRAPAGYRDFESRLQNADFYSGLDEL